MPTPAPPRTEPIALAVTLALAAALRVREALRTPLWFDELYSLDAVQRPFTAMLEVVQRDVHPPLHFLLTWLWNRAGSGDLWVRAFSIGAGILGVAAVWALGRALAGPRAGLIAAAITALHPWHIYISQEGRSYALLWLMLTLTALAAWRLNQAPTPRRAADYAVTAAAALWTHYLAGIVVAVLALWGLAAAGRDRGRLRAWGLAQAGAAALFAPLTPLLLRQIGRARADHWVPPPTAMDLLDIGQRIASTSVLPALAIAALALLPLVVQGRRAAAALLWGAGAGGVLACWALGLAGFRMFAVKYVLFAIPFAAAALALGVEGLRSRRLRAAAAALLVLLLARAAWLRPPQAEAHAFGSVAERIDDRVNPGDVVFHGDTHSWFWGRRYLPGARHVLLLMGRDLPYFEGAGLVPDSSRVNADSLTRAASRGERWWALTVHKAGLDARLAAARFDTLAAAPAETLGLVRLWWSDATGGPRAPLGRLPRP